MAQQAKLNSETLQSLIDVYQVRGSIELLSVILSEAEELQDRNAVIDLLRSLPAETILDEEFDRLRSKVGVFCLNIFEFALAEQIMRPSVLPENQVVRARALKALGRNSEAETVYRAAVEDNPHLRHQELDKQYGIAVSGTSSNVVSLRSYATRRECQSDTTNYDLLDDGLFDDIDGKPITFDDVAGLDDIKAEIRQRIVYPYTKHAAFQRYNRKPGGSLLIYGPPGCGKSLLAQAVAGETDARIIKVQPGDIVDKSPYETERRLRFIFDEARNDTPCILFIDNFEVIAGSNGTIAHPFSSVIVSTLLAQLDECQRNSQGVLVIAATNAPWKIDPAFFSSSRFQRILYAGPPTLQARTHLLKNALGKLPGYDTIKIDKLAKQLDGYSAADIMAIVDRAVDLTLSDSLSQTFQTQLTHSLLDRLRKARRSSISNWIKTSKAFFKMTPSFRSHLY